MKLIKKNNFLEIYKINHFLFINVSVNENFQRKIAKKLIINISLNIFLFRKKRIKFIKKESKIKNNFKISK